MRYHPPLRDMEFVLDDLLDAPARLSALSAHADVDADLMKQVLEEAGRFAAEVIAPINAGGDREGCHFADGEVKTPSGFADAYRQFCEAGWPALACSTEYGGQGLPHLLNCALFEMLSAANHGWTMYPGLLHGAYACLSAHANDTLKARYLDKIVSGEWLATMCLTEAHAGSDLGLLRTRAVRQNDESGSDSCGESYHISGDKIFISGGEQDMTDNIVHLVLARLPDAPSGSKGLSLFLVPKFLPDGARNTVHCTGIEHKMGIRGSATCSMHFENAAGWLVGAEGRGLAAMFVMMNSARLHVGVQGLGIAEAAYQRALAYAQERTQSRAPVRAATTTAADPIVMHPAVQKLLMAQRCRIEGGRMLTYWSGLLLDLAEHDDDIDQRRRHHDRLEFITPVIKAMLTDNGFQSASQALQVFGGHGYVTETGIDQYLRDARITMIYEGSNEIQAIDFLLRKTLADGGGRMTDFLAMVEQDVGQMDDGEFAGQTQQLLQLTSYLAKTTHAIAAATAATPPLSLQLPYFVAEEMLRLTGHAAMAWLWLKAARSALQKHAADPQFYGGKRDSACYYFAFLFPETHQLCGVIDACLAAGAPAIPSDLTHHDAA